MKEFLDLKVSFEEVVCHNCEDCGNEDFEICKELRYECVLNQLYYFKIKTSSWNNEIYNAYVTISDDVCETYYLRDDMTLMEFLNQNKDIKSIHIDNEVDEYEISIDDIISFHTMDYVSELISKQNRELSRNELAERIAEDGQPIRVLHNYLVEAFELLDGFDSERTPILDLKHGVENPIIEGENLQRWKYEDYVNGLLEVASSMIFDLNNEK